MYKLHFREYGNTNTRYCYIKSATLPNQWTVATICMKFSPLDNKLIAVTTHEHLLETCPELRKAIHETLLPLLEKAHKSNAESIINTFMLIHADVK